MIARSVIVIGATFILLFPLLWMVVGSLQNVKSIMRMPPRLIPANISLRSYADLLLEPPGAARSMIFDGVEDVRTPSWVLRWAGNTTVILVVKIAIIIEISLVTAWAFAAYDFAWKNIIFVVYICGMFIPPVLLIPLFVTVKRFGLYNSWWGLILPAAYNTTCVYLLKNYMEAIPTSIVDAARIDGSGELRIMTRIVFPLCKPVIGVMVILITMQSLMDYVWGTLILPSIEKQTLMVGLMGIIQKAEVIQGGVNPIGITLAGGVVIFMPIFLIFLIFQRYFKAEMMSSGIK